MNMCRFLTATTLAAASLLPGIASAQVANISTTDMTVAGYNASSSLVTAVSNTYFSNDENVLLVVKNSGVAVTATVINQNSAPFIQGYGPVTFGNSVVSIPPSSTILIGPFPKIRWNTPIYNTVAVSFTSVAGISESAVRLPPQYSGG
jgi:hypothetical protein